MKKWFAVALLMAVTVLSVAAPKASADLSALQSVVDSWLVSDALFFNGSGPVNVMTGTGSSEDLTLGLYNGTGTSPEAFLAEGSFGSFTGTGSFGFALMSAQNEVVSSEMSVLNVPGLNMYNVACDINGDSIYSDFGFCVSGNIEALPGTNGVSAVPEPASLVLLGAGLIGAAGFARRKFVA